MEGKANMRGARPPIAAVLALLLSMPCSVESKGAVTTYLLVSSRHDIAMLMNTNDESSIHRNTITGPKLADSIFAVNDLAPYIPPKPEGVFRCYEVKAQVSHARTL